MSSHRTVQRLLYDFVHGELNLEEREHIEEHLAECARCSSELESLRETLKAFPASTPAPSDEHPAEFWDAFATRIESDIYRREQAGIRPVPRRRIRSPFVVLRYPVTTAAACIIAVLLLGTLAWHRFFQSTPPMTTETILVPRVTVDTTADQMSQYFLKSKILLVGLANMKTPPDEPIDLSQEKRVSRELVNEARFLRRRSLDVRSTRLINDLDRVFTGLANAKEEFSPSRVEMIRGGIRRENLLYKVRMAETMFELAKSERPRDNQ